MFKLTIKPVNFDGWRICHETPGKLTFIKLYTLILWGLMNIAASRSC